MNPFELTEEQFNELVRLCGLYRREAKKCMQAKSYVAGCVMIGAAMEADLTAMCHCYSDEISKELIPRKNGKPKHILKWSFFDLLKVARKCEWLPARLSLQEEWNQKKAEIGDWAEVVRQFRNLVHPSWYISIFPKSRITKNRMEMCFEVAEVAGNYYLAKLSKSIKAAISKAEKRKVNDHV